METNELIIKFTDALNGFNTALTNSFSRASERITDNTRRFDEGQSKLEQRVRNLELFQAKLIGVVFGAQFIAALVTKALFK